MRSARSITRRINLDASSKINYDSSYYQAGVEDAPIGSPTRHREHDGQPFAPGARRPNAAKGRNPFMERDADPIVDLRTLYLKDLRFFGCTVLDAGVFASLVRYIENGEIRPLIAASYPLSGILEAQQEFLQKRRAGKNRALPMTDEERSLGRQIALDEFRHSLGGDVKKIGPEVRQIEIRIVGFQHGFYALRLLDDVVVRRKNRHRHL